MRKIVYTRPDGGLSVVIPVLNTGETITEAEAEQRAWDRLPADAINARWVNESELPVDRTFRDAWVDTGTVVVDMPRARALHRDRLRRIRAPKLALLDAQYNRAVDMNDTVAMTTIAQQRQDMRNATQDPRIDAAQTPEELAVVIPAVLQ